MADRRLLATILAGLILVAAAVGLEQRRERATAPAREGALAMHAEVREASLRFAPDVAEVDRAVVLGAIERARPEARRLIDEVDGLVDVYIKPTGAGTAGLMRRDGDRFRVELDLGSVYRALGRKGTDRLVLHELGHVVDAALTPEELDERLDAMIPAGFGCDYGTSGACAPRRERFAETFAKWALGDIGVNALGLGYKVPPPSSLEDWGASLVAGVNR
jgi:hypothetical protein